MAVIKEKVNSMRVLIKQAMVVAGVVMMLAAGSERLMASDTVLDETRIKALVKEVIKENPELIQDSLNQYRAQQRKIQEEKQFEAMFENRVPDTVSAWNPQKGPSDAAVTIIEYTDFQCPYCTRGARTLHEVKDKYGDKIRVVFKNLPLQMHPQARPAAKAALAAHRQGKFWEYHDLLFKNSRNLNEDNFVKMAQTLGLDMEKFNSDRNSKEIADQVQADMDQAKKLGLTGTPNFLVNGVKIKGAYPADHFSKVIDRLLKEGGKQD